MVNKKRIEKPLAIQTWEEADKTLKEIKIVTKLIETFKKAAAREIESIEKRLKAEIVPLERELQQHELNLEAFVFAKRNELKGKSKTLKNGLVAIRKTTTWQYPRNEILIKKLKEKGLTQFIQVIEKPIRNAIRSYKYHEDLGVSKRVIEHLYYKLK
jgi:phage host-nuclease inhibitor protein Gam